jgi:hypothetical protein
MQAQHYHIEESTDADGITTGAIVQDTSTWQADEIDQLRADLEESEGAIAALETESYNWYESYEKSSEELRHLKDSFQDKLNEENMALRDKSMIYLSLINEFEDLIDSMMVKVPTDRLRRILNLKKRGEMIA